VRRRAELGDWAEEERAYAGDEFEDLHDCPALEQVGPARPNVQRARRRERARSSGSKQRARMHKHVCACPGGQPIRAATTDLQHVTCSRCGSYFVWAPTPSELDDDTLAGRRPA